MTDQHPLTDEMLQELVGAGLVGSIYIREYMRAAYDLGFKAGSQASVGAMDALRRTIEENIEAMRILAMGDEEEMYD